MMFSIVIPTRNSAKTIRETIKSCLDQDFADYEVIVHDNASTDNTREIVKSFRDSRIAFSENASPVYMTDNWNRALERAKGEWIIFLGSDDAIRRSSLKKLSNAIENLEVESIVWSQCLYTWPTFGLANQANRISIPPITKNIYISTIDSHRDELMAGELPSLPSIYYGCISKKLIERCRHNGNFFDSRTPDLYSAIVMSFFTDHYLRIDDCLTITALSASSSGTAQLSIAPNLEVIRNDLSALLETSSISMTLQVPQVDLKTTWVMDCILLVQAKFARTKSAFEISTNHVAKLIKDEILDEGGVSLEHQKILSSWFSRNGLEIDFDLASPVTEKNRILNSFPSDEKNLKIGQFYLLDTIQFGINSSYEAAQFVDNLELVYPLLNLDHNELVKRTNDYEALLDELKQEVEQLRAIVNMNK